MEKKYIKFREDLPFEPDEYEFLYVGGMNPGESEEWAKANSDAMQDILLKSYDKSDLKFKCAGGIVESFLKSESFKYYYPGAFSADNITVPSFGAMDIWKYLVPGEKVPQQGAFLCYSGDIDLPDEESDYNNFFFNFYEVKASSADEFVAQFAQACKEFELFDKDGVRYSSTVSSNWSSDWDADDYFDDEIRRLASEIEQRVDQLRLYGVDEALIKSLFGERAPLSRLLVTKEYGIFLPDYDNMEIKMEPLQKAVYLLFLRHPEGILFKELGLYRRELTGIYKEVTNRVDIGAVENSIRRLTDPMDNSINEKCSRIKEAFVSRMSEETARSYYIFGLHGQPKRIALDPELVVWQK